MDSGSSDEAWKNGVNEVDESSVWMIFFLVFHFFNLSSVWMLFLVRTFQAPKVAVGFLFWISLSTLKGKN